MRLNILCNFFSPFFLFTSHDAQINEEMAGYQLVHNDWFVDLIYQTTPLSVLWINSLNFFALVHLNKPKIL